MIPAIRNAVAVALLVGVGLLFVWPIPLETIGLYAAGAGLLAAVLTPRRRARRRR